MENLLSNRQTARQSQQLSQQLTAAQLQGLNILSTPLQELSGVLAQELENNPLLEITAPGQEELAGEPLSAAAEASNNIDVNEFDGDRENFPLLEKLQNIWDDSPELDDPPGGDPEAASANRDFMFGSIASQQTLVDILTEQLEFCILSPREKLAAELVIGSLDERGFLQTHPADIAMSGELTLDEVDTAIKLIQSFDPPGVGARDAAESLILQLKRRNYPDPRIYTLLNDHQDELERNKLPQIAKAMNVDIEEIYSMLNDLKKLNCIPASGLENNNGALTVAPEMSIELVNDKLVVNGREQYLPKLGLVRSYLKMLDDPGISADTRQYLQEKLSSAENLIRSLELRQDTLTGITQVIARKQDAYFRNGIACLQPMTMAEVAQELDLHETTVSRAVSGKYLDTPQGVKEYRFFFSGGYKNADGEDVSSRGVKELIRRIIEEEDPRKPLSDQAISLKLMEQGLNVARRTVAKYRESMNIAPTNLRRRH